MSKKRQHRQRAKQASLTAQAAAAPIPTMADKAMLPLGALMLAASVSSWAQTQTAPAAPAAAPETTLGTVTVKDAAEVQSKDTIMVKKTTIGKGNQDIKDIPQSVTVFTEKLMTDRNQDDFRDVLRTTAGVTFQAGETGEEDVRLRGFSLGQAGDIYVDGMKDAPLYERCSAPISTGLSSLVLRTQACSQSTSVGHTRAHMPPSGFDSRMVLAAPRMLSCAMRAMKLGTSMLVGQAVAQGAS